MINKTEKKEDAYTVFANAPQATTLIPSNEGKRIASNLMSNITNYPADKDSAAHRDGNCDSVLILVRTLKDVSQRQETYFGFKFVTLLLSVYTNMQ